MKKYILALGTAAVLLSCQKEIGFENGTTSGTNTGSGTGTGNGTTGSTVSNTDYQPNTKNSKWNMVSTGAGNYTILSVGTDTTINGTKYYAFDHSIGGREYISKDNGVYKTAGNFPQTGGWVIYTYLKDATVGNTWTETLSAGGSSFLMKFKVVGTGLQRTVNGKLYSNVLKIIYEQSVAGINTAIGEQYYAKGVGPIEAVSRIDMFGIQMTTDSTYLESSIIN